MAHSKELGEIESGVATPYLCPADVETLFAEAQPGLVHDLQCRFSLPHEAAEDLMQEAFLRAWQALQRGASVPTSAGRAWLWRIASNAAIDAYRHAQRRRQVELPKQTDGGDPEEQVIARLTLEALLASLERTRAEGLLLTVVGYSQHEIGQRQGLSASAVKTRLVRTRAELRAQAARERASA